MRYGLVQIDLENFFIRISSSAQFDGLKYSYSVHPAGPVKKKGNGRKYLVDLHRTESVQKMLHLLDTLLKQ